MSDEELEEIKRYHFERNKRAISHEPSRCHTCRLVGEIVRLRAAMREPQAV